MFPFSADWHKSPAARCSRPSLLVFAGLLGGQLIVSAASVFLVFISPWIVGPGAADDGLDPHWVAWVAVSLIAGTAFLGAVVSGFIRRRNCRPIWWLPVVGGVVTAATALVALVVLA